MVLTAAAFVAGASLFQLFPILPDGRWLLLLLLLPLLWYRFPSCKPLWTLLIGLLWAFLHASWVLDAKLPADMERKDLEVKGCIVSLPEQMERRIRFEFAVEQAHFDEQRIASPGKIRLSWYKGHPQSLTAGDCWHLQVRLKRPHGSYNPGGFDYEGWLFRQGIRATGYVRQWDGTRQLESREIRYGLHRMRQQVRERLETLAGELPGMALIKALSLGDRSGLDPATWQHFTRTGTNHLIAISGLHIGIVAGWGYLLMQFLWSRSVCCTQRIPAPVAAAFASLILATLYAALAGFSVPTQRALVMLVVVMGSRILRLTATPAKVLAVALLFVVILDPLSLLSPGFWLSFAAVAVILFSMGNRLENGWWFRWGRVQWVVAIGLFPLLLLLFSRVSLIAPVVNLIVVPWFTLILVPLAMLVLLLLPLPYIAEPLLQLASRLLSGTTDLLAWAAQLPEAVWITPNLSPWVLLSLFIAIILLLLPRGFPARWLGVVLMLPVLMPDTERPGHGEIAFTMLDVGQGLATVVRTQNHTLVYDTGARFSDRFDVGSAIVVPFLQHSAIHQVDTLILSNGDADHSGGSEALLQAFPVSKVLSGEPERFQNPSVSGCRAGMQWQWDGVDFLILHPHDNDTMIGNNSSCVLKVSNLQGSLLLTGDIEQQAEQLLLSRHGEQLATDIVQVPHHGSMTSSTPDFVTAVAPRFALISAGYRNQYNFPRPEIRQRWQERGAQFLDTASSRAIHFRLLKDGRILGPQRERDSRRHYWSML